MGRKLGCVLLVGWGALWAGVDFPPIENLIAVDYGEIPDTDETPVVYPEETEDEPVKADALPEGLFKHATDPYLEGYIQALVDMHYYEFQVLVSVKDHVVYLSNLPRNELIANSIISFVRDLPDVKGVEVKAELAPAEVEARKRYVEKPQVDGVWFPQSTVLFPPLLADPREPKYAAAVRWGDHVVGTTAVAVALGDDFPIFRWRDVFRWHGALQIGIGAGVWAVFNFHDVHGTKHNGNMCELVNTDYMLAIPLTYAFDKWAFRLRLYHISGHLGDEFICNHPEYVQKRRNPSFEAIDFYTSYQFSSNLRFFVGPGVVFHSDKSFKLKPLYVGWGGELRLFGRKLYYHKLYGTPFLALFMENWQQHHWDIDTTVMIGYEVSKLQGVGRKMRVYADWHQGFSYEGQFFNERTHYGEIGLSWGF
jgi:hypothetical protein